MLLLESVQKRYRHASNDQTVLNGLSAKIEEGRFAVILGRSGCGKSTLLNLVAGLDRDYEGSISVNGQRLERLSDAHISRLRGAHTGLVFQNPVFLEHLSCIDNLSFAARFGNGDSKRERLLGLLERLQIRDLADAKPGTLSGGQLQRLSLARALSGDPRLLLCDEPTGNLDADTGAALIEELSAWHDARHTLLVVTHDARVAERAQDVWRLSDGRLHKEAM